MTEEQEEKQPKSDKRVTAEQIAELLDAADIEEHIFWGKELLMSYMLPCGFTVTGRAACVDPANFDMEVGRHWARKDAESQLWKLEGYVLQQRLAGLIEEPLDRVELAAMLAHEVNRAYCEALGDDSQLPWDDAPEWARESARAGVLAHQRQMMTAEESHQCWMDHKIQDGWRYGPVKDPEAKTHPCMMPYDQLPVEQRLKDHLFRAVVHHLV